MACIYHIIIPLPLSEITNLNDVYGYKNALLTIIIVDVKEMSGRI